MERIEVFRCPSCNVMYSGYAGESMKCSKCGVVLLPVVRTQEEIQTINILNVLQDTASHMEELKITLAESIKEGNKAWETSVRECIAFYEKRNERMLDKLRSLHNVK